MGDFLWITIIPDFIVKSLPAASLILVGYLAEKKYVGRVSTFCNTMAINLQLVLITNPNTYLVWYANLGLLMGILGIYAYSRQNSLPQPYYWLSWLYCSIIAGLFVLLVH